MSIHQIDISRLRNIQSACVKPSTNFTLLIGNNGSGKTSFLEAVHLLSLGRSFRSHQYKKLISHGAQQMVVRADINQHIAVGIEKNSNGQSRININGEACHTAAMLAEMLPLQLINPDSYKILEAGPAYRRGFLDWGVFHVKHPFFKLWQQGRHIVRQRNAALRQTQSKQQIKVWDKELINVAETLSEMRQEYINAYLPIFNDVYSQLLSDEIQLTYYAGWNQPIGLEDVLNQSFERDQHLGYTQFGPHRADLKLTVNKIAVTDVLSRGQQKLLVCAMKIAQGILLRQQTKKSCIYLIDDLAAELDNDKRTKMASLLKGLESQVFVTAVNESALVELQKYDGVQMFHVEHGCISEYTMAR